MRRVARTARPGVASVSELAKLLPDADVVVLLAPVTQDTIGMVNAEIFLPGCGTGRYWSTPRADPFW